MPLTRTHRRIIFWIVVGAYTLCVPIVLLVASGYRLDFNNYTYKKTGLLVVDVLPQDVTIQLNNLPAPSILRDHKRVVSYLTGGRYTLNISQEGFYSWQAPIAIIEGQATIISNLVLLPKGPPTLLTKEQFSFLRSSPSGELVVGVRANQPKTLWIISNDGTQTQIAGLPDGAIEDISFSSSEDAILASIKQHLGTQWFIIPVHENTAIATPLIVPSSIGEVQQVRWDPWSSKKLLVLAQKHLWYFNATTNRLEPFEDQHIVTSFSSVRRTLYYTTSDNNTFNIMEQSQFGRPTQVWTLPKEVTNLQAIDDQMMLVWIKENNHINTIVLQNTSGVWQQHPFFASAHTIIKRNNDYIASGPWGLRYNDTTSAATTAMTDAIRSAQTMTSSSLPVIAFQPDAQRLSILVLSSPQRSTPTPIIHSSTPITWTMIDDSTLMVSATINNQPGLYVLELDPRKNANRS